MPSHLDLRSFLASLERDGELVTVEAPVDPHLEMAEIHRRVIAANGPALLFRNPSRGNLPVVTNLFGTAERVERAFGKKPLELVNRLTRLPQELLPPSLGKLWAQRGLWGELRKLGLRRKSGPVLSVRQGKADLAELPMLTTWQKDGGPFITLPLVYTEHPDTGAHNLGMYRMQRFDSGSCGIHWQIGKGGGFHHHLAESRGESLPVNVFLGGPPAAILAAIAPLPENLPELILASLLAGEKLPMAANPQGPLPLLATAELALVGEVRPHERRPEGPFGDHYGYYSLEHPFPVFHCSAILRRQDAIYPATVVGKPRQEDFYIGEYLQNLLAPVFPLVMPAVEDLWSYGETGFHSLAAAVVKERYKREAMMSAFRILGEGQLSLTKFLLVLDERRDLRNFRETLTHVLERFDPATDLYVLGNLSMDTLDYNGPRLNEGSKGVLLGMGKPIRELPQSFQGELPKGFSQARVFCPGCLVVSGPNFEEEPDAALRAARHEPFSRWPLLVLADDAAKASASEANFLWTTFTRFEPAADLYASSVELRRLHPSFRAPVVIDSRLKPGFPEELFCDEETARLVDRRWKEYFPSREVPMGDSDRAHLD